MRNSGTGVSEEFLFAPHSRSLPALHSWAVSRASLRVSTMPGCRKAAPSIRNSVFGIAHSVAIAAFGGTTQLVVTWLIHWAGSAMAPAWYLIGASVVGQIALIDGSRERARQSSWERAS